MWFILYIERNSFVSIFERAEFTGDENKTNKKMEKEIGINLLFVFVVS